MSASDVVVVGAGPAGLGVALAAQDRGLRPLVVDRADQVGSAWRRRYDRLRLNTCRPLSHLPSRRFPPGTPMFPTRDQLVAHLQGSADDAGLDLRLGTDVERVDRVGDAWSLTTSSETLRASQVVVATGYEAVPHVPAWPGRELFTGELLHAAGYRNAEPFRGRSVLVVGAGCSGMEVAHDLAEGGAAEVWLAVRTPPNILLRASPGPVPSDAVGVALLHLPVRVADAVTRVGQRLDTGDLAEFGLPFPEEGVFSRVRRHAGEPTIVDPEMVAAIKSRAFTAVAAVEELDRTGVRLADGSRLEPDAIVCATGYRRGLEPLVGHLGLLDAHGVPKVLAPSPAGPGLWFVGFVPRPGALGALRKEARRTARALVSASHDG
ncbi:MAG: flavin-containing monooxygenase [Nocardioidaceae bacterium]